MNTTVMQAECHDTCLDVRSESGHECNVNPVGMSTRWRVDCDHCGTCIRVVGTKEEAVQEAKAHVKLTVEEFWEIRDAEFNAVNQ